MLVFVGRICCFLLFIQTSCTGFRDSGKYPPETTSSLKMILDLARSEKVSTYSYIEAGQQGNPEYSKIDIRISADSLQYHHREIFSEYDNGRGGNEYSVIEFILNTEDSLSRQKYEEYQVVAEKDSVYITAVSPFEMLLTHTLKVTYSETEFPLYRLDGYAHPGDPEPSHYKFWSPRFGIVLIWYGEGTVFELIASPDEADTPLLIAMKEKALATI
ncbi:MAG: hypothetical protein SF052_06040 [Bacteroidia bacterium]|nr:hypothetical protein [Bacteroidia bacterium]